MTEPISWFVIERGWEVAAADGTQVGRVEEVLGDRERDIFNGLTVLTGFLTARYVPAERVRAIFAGRVELDLSPEEVEALEAHEPPA